MYGLEMAVGLPVEKLLVIQDCPDFVTEITDVNLHFNRESLKLGATNVHCLTSSNERLEVRTLHRDISSVR